MNKTPTDRKAQATIIGHCRRPHRFDEKPVQMSRRHPRNKGDLTEAERVGNMTFHKRHRLMHARRGGPDTVRHRGALRCCLGANIGVQEPVADMPRKHTAMMAGDQRMHQIERRCATATRHPVAVDDKQAALNNHITEMFGQQRRMFPMNCHPITIHQPGLDQHHRAARHTADLHPRSRHPVQPCEHMCIIKTEGITTRQHQQQIKINGVSDFIGSFNHGSARAAGSWGLTKMNNLIERSLRQQVGGTKRFNRAGIGHQRKSGDGQDPDSKRARY